MRKIKLGKGLLKSLFPSKKKKKSSAKKNESPSTAASGASTNQTNCPPILGGGRRKKEQRPYELHQEGASSPPSSDDEGRDINNVKSNIIDNNGGVGEQLQLHPTPTPQQQQQEDDCIERDKDSVSPITVTYSTSEESEVTEIVEAVEKVEVEVNENEEEQQQQQQGKLASFGHHQFAVAVTSPLTSPLTSPHSSPSRDEARRKAIARQQRILSQSSTRFQALSETATIDTSGFAYSSPPHLQRRRWQQHIGRQRPPLPVPAIVGQELEEKPKVPSTQGLAELPRKQLLPPSNANCTSVVFYDATPAKNLTVDVCQKKNEQGGKHISPTCVADLENIEVLNPISPTALTSSSNSSYSTSTTTGKNNIHFFILLLCPHSRIFEVVEIWDAPREATVGDVLKLIPRHITEKRLLKKKYIGLCRPADRVEFIDLTVPAFLMKNDNQGEDSAPFDFIHESDVLVAILKGSTGYQMCKISKPILKNPKFKEMIRRRRRQTVADKAAAKKKRKSKKRQTDNLQSPTKAIYIPDDSSIVSGITHTRQLSGKDDPISLSKMLETLSQKLHELEEDGAILPGCDDSSVGSSAKRSVVSDLDQVKRKTTISDVSVKEVQQAGFEMSPKMLAMELAQTIEDIFANQNVEIVAVDADDNDDEDSTLANDDSDADTFVSARSHRSKSTLSARKSAQRMPRNVVTKSKPIPRQFKFTETMEDNALAAQIEAMAAQADAAFEDRSKKNSSRRAAQSEKNSTRKAPQPVPVIDKTETKKEVPVTAAAAPSMEVADIDSDTRSFQSTFDDALSHIGSEDVRSCTENDDECKEKAEEKAKVTSITKKDVVNRQFLNASTSTVSKMVADNEGRVNEMHVLESLGCTIVCIAANYMQKARHSGKPSPIESKDVFQSSTFLAFMVSGQRYLAKVTEK